MMNLLASQQKERRSTRTRLPRNPILVDAQRIVMTDVADGLLRRNLEYSPICLVPYSEIFFIVDGNHRFQNKKLVERNNLRSVAAWVLSEEDRDKVFGDPLPQKILDWKRGTITFEELCEQAKLAAQEAYRKGHEIIRIREKSRAEVSEKRNVDRHVAALERMGYEVTIRKVK